MSDFFFFKQKTAYEMRISDWSSDVCSSDLLDEHLHVREPADVSLGHRQVQIGGDGLGQRAIAVAGQDLGITRGHAQTGLVGGTPGGGTAVPSKRAGTYPLRPRRRTAEVWQPMPHDRPDPNGRGKGRRWAGRVVVPGQRN